MKAMVTGGAGFIGSHLVDLLVNLGHDVTVVDSLRYSGRSKNLSNSLGTRCVLERTDIGDGADIRRLLKRDEIDVIFNLAAETHVTRSIESPHRFLETNVVGTGVMLGAAVEWWRTRGDGFRFVHVSTDEVYGSLPENSGLLFTETSPYDPRNPYAASKASSDHLVRAYSNTFGLPVIITHCSNNYGTRQHPEKLIPTIIRQITQGNRFTLHGDGRHIRDWLHVTDHVDGLFKAATLGVPGETYNFGGRCELTNLAMVSLICVALGRDKICPIEFVDDRPGNDRRYGTDITKVSDKLKWCPTRNLQVNIGPTVQWYLDNSTYADDYGR